MEAILNFVSGITFDLIILLFVAFVLTLDSVRNGTNRAISLALAMPLTLVLYKTITATAILGTLFSTASPYVQTGTVIALLILLFFLMSRLVDSYSVPGFFRGLLAAIAATIMIVVVWNELTPLATLWKFGSPMDSVFNVSYMFYWIVGALAILGFARS